MESSSKELSFFIHQVQRGEERKQSPLPSLIFIEVLCRSRALKLHIELDKKVAALQIKLSLPSTVFTEEKKALLCPLKLLLLMQERRQCNLKETVMVHSQLPTRTAQETEVVEFLRICLQLLFSSDRGRKREIIQLCIGNNVLIAREILAVL